jgi:hypothetical protein
MNKIDDGGPIAPNMVTRTAEGVSSVIEAQGGMTLRDHFAAAALQGWLASYGPEAPHPIYNETAMNVALNSYRMADAMIAARKEGV